MKKLGKYELLEEIGRGALGEVYKAHDPSLERLVALKTIAGSLVQTPELLERFYQEARSAGMLHHPNIITIYELGKHEDTPFIAMEFIEGASLDKIISRRPALPLSQKVGFIVPVCRALDHAHRRGVVHRDIKPGNVMLSKDGVIKVVDFGIARLVDTSKTQTNMIIGTMAYMSPQQFHGERADQRSDVWSVGVMLYELICFRRPFEGEDSASLILNIVDEKKNPLPVRDFAPDCSSELEVLIGRMLRKDVNERFQTMEEVLFELEPIWRSLQEENIAGLITNSEILIRAQDFPRARDLLRQALQMDSRHDRAKLLLDQVNTELKRIQTKSQINKSLEKAQGLLKDARYQEAETEIESALKLDASFEPAHELLAQVQRSEKRARQVLDGVRLAKLRLADGALTEASDAIQKALELDAVNPSARTLQQLIHEQLARRAERKRLVGILQRARDCWADQRLEECMALLTAAQGEFPDEPEIAKLLETARRDQEDQQKREKLAEARKLLAAERYDDCLAIVESLLAHQPNDIGVQVVRDLVLQEREELQRRQELQKQMANLHVLMNSEKFSKAVSRGEALLRKFPRETEIVEIVEFARAELSQAKMKHDLDAVLQGIRREIYAGRLREAVAAAEKAIARFPRHAELDALLDQAHTKLQEEQNRELLHKRIAEIRRNIAAEQHTDAADLARQTLSTLGPDTQVASLLRVAEMEMAYKLEKQENQQNQVAGEHKPFGQGNFETAAQALQDGLETQLLSETDPLATVKDLNAGLAFAAAASQGREDLVKDYAFLRNAFTPQVPLEQSGASQPSASALAYISETVESAAGMLPRIPAATPSAPGGADQVCEGALAEDVPKEPTETSVVSALRHLMGRLAYTIREKPIRYASAGLIVLFLIVSVRYLVVRRATAEQIALAMRAQQLEKEKNWPAALKEYSQLAALSGPIAKASREPASRLEELSDRENSLYAAAQSEESNGNFSHARQLYQQSANLHGDREADALNSVARLTPQPTPAEPVTKPNNQPTLLTAKQRISRAASSNKVQAAGKGCELLQSDYADMLDRADTNRARGMYSDATREYNAVLACDPGSERARAGLDRTKASLVTPN